MENQRAGIDFPGAAFAGFAQIFEEWHAGDKARAAFVARRFGATAAIPVVAEILRQEAEATARFAVR